MRTEQERLAHYRAAFLEKVKKWKWNDEEECPYKRRGRKAKPIPKPTIDYTKPRNQKYKWI